MSISCLIVTGHADLPETQLIIGLFRQGVDLVVLCPKGAPNRQLLLDAKVPVRHLALKGRFHWQGIQTIRRELKLQSFDIVHCFNSKALSNSLIAALGYSCKMIAYRGIVGNVSYKDPMSWMTYLHPKVDSIVCVADAIRRYFWDMKIWGRKWPVKKAVTIYKGHDPEWYQDSFPLASFNIPEGEFLVGCTVNDRPRKGLAYLIEALALLPKGLPIHFVFIGNIFNQKILSMIEQSPYAGNIHVLGFQKQAAALIRNCDVCILPAIKREGLPKAIIEGMIQSVAPIVTNAGGSPELIEHGKSGLIIPPRSAAHIAEAIVHLYEHPAKLTAMQSAARQRIIDGFSAEKTVTEHLALYKSLLGGKG